MQSNGLQWIRKQLQTTGFNIGDKCSTILASQALSMAKSPKPELRCGRLYQVSRSLSPINQNNLIQRIGVGEDNGKSTE